MLESDPAPREVAPNFYYPQEDLLLKFCEQSSGATDWNVIRPAGVIGTTDKPSMNMYYPFGPYAAIQAHKKEPIEFGGDFDIWQHESYNTSAKLTGYLSEWAVLEDICANQAFNAQDSSPLSFDRFYEELVGGSMLKKVSSDLKKMSRNFRSAKCQEAQSLPWVMDRL
jgi:nucleoside-diphosphate-sugar epimerase